MNSYWETELYSKKYDLIIIGAGLVGQSTALFYKQNHPSANVLILDRGFYPLGASTRNAGFACFGSVTEHIADLELEDIPNVKQRIKQRYEGLKLLRETLGDEQIGYEERGGFEIFTDNYIYQNAVSRLGFFNEWLYEITGNNAVYSETGCNGYKAIKIEGEGSLHAGKMMNTLHQKNLSLGVEFRWETPVAELDPDDGRLTLANGVSIAGNRIVCATNAFTAKLLKNSLIQPGRGYVFVTKPIRDLAWKGTFHYDEGYYYFRNIGEDRLLLGGARNQDKPTENTDVFGINEKIKKHLIRFSSNILKLPDGWEIEQEWSGIMGFTPTKSPVLEKAGEKCIVAAGLSGMGVALGMQLAKEVIGQLA